MSAVLANLVDTRLHDEADRPLSIVLAAWAPFHAGAEVAAERLACGLRDDGHRVVVLLGTDGETCMRMRDAGIDVCCVPLALTDRLRWWRYHSARREVRRLLQEIQPDLLHANDLPTSQMIGESAAKLGIPRICHHRWIFAGQAIDWLNKFGAERHLFVSQALMSDLCRASARLAASERAVVHDGLPLPAEPTEADRVAARRRLALPLDRLLVLFAGQIIERKGVADLLYAWKQLSTTRSAHADLIVIGEDLENRGEYRRHMESLAAELNCPARFMGFQQNVSEWIIASDICVVPSHAEPLGNATLEAMAHGRPVIGADVGGIPEMIVDGVTGILVPPRDPKRLASAIQKLLEDSSLRTRMGLAGRRRCEEKFSLRAHIDTVVREYRQVVAWRPHVPA